MEQKQYMVLGIKDAPTAEENTEKDNPFIFNHLPSAIRTAQKIAEQDYYAHSRVVEIKSVVEFSGADFIPKGKSQD